MRWNPSVALLSAVACLVAPVLNVAKAQCPALPYQILNGQVADAMQLMANFDAVTACLYSKGAVNSGTAGQVGYYGATGTAISGQSPSVLLDSALGSAQGSIAYRSANTWASLAPGATGNMLQSGGPSAPPSWRTSGGGITTIVGAGIGSSASTVALPSVPVISRPSLAFLTWLNQASATATDSTNGPLVLRTTQNTGSVNGINALIKSVAGSDWTVTVQYALGNHTGDLGGSVTDLSGLIIYNSVNGRIFICGIGATGSVNVWAYNSTTSHNSFTAAKTILVTPGSVWIRAQYISSTTTLAFSYSIDGFTWESVYSTNAPFTGVPTGYGIGVGTYNNTTGYVLSLNYMTDSSP